MKILVSRTAQLHVVPFSLPNVKETLSMAVGVRSAATILSAALTRCLLAGLTTVLACVMAIGCAHAKPGSTVERQVVRRNLFPPFTPSTLANCTLKRYGHMHPGAH